MKKPSIYFRILLIVLNGLGCSHLQTSSVNYSPAWPHDEIHEVFPNIFFVTGTNKTEDQGTKIQTSRNMIIVRNQRELTLVNTVRLDAQGLEKLDTLGDVAHVVKIGSFHGRDDAFYLDRYHAKFWALKGMKHENGKSPDVEMVPGGSMPFPGSSLFIFETASQPEGIIHLSQEGGILISCDSIKNWTHVDRFFSKETGDSMMAQGLIKPANVDSVWLGALNVQSMDFVRLKTISFRHLLSAHGEPLLNHAFEQLSETLRKRFNI